MVDKINQKSSKILPFFKVNNLLCLWNVLLPFNLLLSNSLCTEPNTRTFGHRNGNFGRPPIYNILPIDGKRRINHKFERRRRWRETIRWMETSAERQIHLLVSLWIFSKADYVHTSLFFLKKRLIWTWFNLHVYFDVFF